MYFELAPKVTFGQLQYALAAFEEVGLISRKGSIKMIDVKTKTNLEDTNVLKVLKGRL